MSDRSGFAGLVLSNKMSGGFVPIVAVGDYKSIATVSVGSGGQDTVTFSSIPATFKHLQIRAIHRVTGANAVGDVYMRVGNSTVDSGSNYSNHVLGGDGTSPAATGGGSRTSVMGYDFYNSIGAGGLANAFATGIIDILDYANTSKNKTMRFLEGREFNSNNNDGRVYLESGAWLSTSAINIITFYALTGTGEAANFVQYSHFALYGIKG
jgi:hypothetical protein